MQDNANVEENVTGLENINTGEGSVEENIDIISTKRL